MSKFDMIVELMVKNGVTTKFSENLFKNLSISKKSFLFFILLI